MDYLQPQMFFEMVEVAVAVQQLVVFLDAESGDKGIHGVANRNAESTQFPVILCRGDGQGSAASFKDNEMA
jgi:hypothetical protein